jgi:toxin ParE1/3/4
MARVIRSPTAKRDVLKIWVRVAEDSISAADRLIDSFDDALNLIVRFPGMGAVRDELMSGLRSYPVGSYLLFYRKVKSGIQLVRVIHGARNLKRQFPRPRP